MADQHSLIGAAMRGAGRLITLAALVFVVLALYRQWSEVSAWRPTLLQIWLLLSLPIGYAAALMLLAFNWATIVTAVIGDTPPRALLLHSYTRTQIAKYVPGNIVHLVGRHMYLRDYGAAHRPLAIASLIELASLPVAAAIALTLVTPTIEMAGLGLYVFDALVWVLPIVTAGGVYAIALLMPKNQRTRFVTVLACGAGFMVAQGIIFAVILAAVNGTFVIAAIPAAILAWLAGFLTPGAPGGIAVREAVLVSLLAYVGMQDGVLLAAVLFRFVTTAGDLVLFISGNLLFRSD